MRKSVFPCAHALVVLSLLGLVGCYSEVEPADSSAEKAIAIDLVEPPCAEPGSEAGYIEGTGFGAENVTITVGGIPAEVLAATGMDASFIVPAEGLSPGDEIEVVVMNPGGRLATIQWVACGCIPGDPVCGPVGDNVCLEYYPLCIDGFCLAPDPAPKDGTHCGPGEGPEGPEPEDQGHCAGGTCLPNDWCDPATVEVDCRNKPAAPLNPQCTVPTCTAPTGFAYVCGIEPVADGSPCAFDGVCEAGVCDTVTITDLGLLLPGGGNYSLATDINDAGQVVGFSTTGGSWQSNHAFLWFDGVMSDLGTPGVYSEAAGINNVGDIVGSSGLSPTRAVMWKNGTLIDLGTLGGSASWASAVNEKSQVTGYSLTPAGGAEAFLWDAGSMVSIGAFPAETVSQGRDINDLGEIVGLAAVPGGRVAFLWDGGPLRALESLGDPDDPDDIAFGMNNTGLIAGYSTPSSGPPRQAVLWEGATIVEIFGNGEAYDVNDLSQVVGRIDGGAFFWQDGTLIELPRLSTQDCYAMAINNNGQVVGQCWLPHSTHAVLWTLDFSGSN